MKARPLGYRAQGPRPVNCNAWLTSRIKAGVEKTSPGRWVASVLAMINLANELFSSSVRKLSPGGAFKVVEAVAVLQLLHLGLEDEVEGRAEETAERHLLLGQAADPEVDGVDAGGRRGAVQKASRSAGTAVEEVVSVPGWPSDRFPVDECSAAARLS